MTHAVTFKGVNRTVQAEEGETLLALAQRIGIHLDSSCGGNGSCHQCRVLIHAGREYFLREGKPCEPRHKRGNDPVFLACQGGVFGKMEVEPAPVQALHTDHPVASLLGWNVGELGREVCVLDPGSFTGGRNELDAEGNFTSERAFIAQQLPEETTGQVVLGTDVDYADALALGTNHLPVKRRVVLDFAGRLALCDGDNATVQGVPTNAFLGGMAHLAGAIDSVEWSPIKTRTVITTVGGAPPAGVCASGLLSCVKALMQAGMCDARLQLSESRFTTRLDGQLAALLVGPGAEAQSPHGQVYTVDEAIVVTQSQLNVIRDAASMLRQRLDALDAHALLVVTGDFGTYVDPVLVHALGIRNGSVEFVPHAAALGAARWAATPR
jgi:uncharacterized 2Fe-2S/4Fe-4S cluster protein (DUF4445 family)